MRTDAGTEAAQHLTFAPGHAARSQGVEGVGSRLPNPDLAEASSKAGYWRKSAIGGCADGRQIHEQKSMAASFGLISKAVHIFDLEAHIFRSAANGCQRIGRWFEIISGVKPDQPPRQINDQMPASNVCRVQM